MPVGEGVVYSVQRLEGKDVAAIAPQPPEQGAAGMPPVWNSYVSVASADDAAQRAGGLGATVVAPPFDVLDAGRMAVVRDPQGAFFMVWEPRRHFGCALVNAPGALSWNELASPDLDASAAFYRELFGWTIEPFPDSPTPYLTIRNGDGGNGGMRAVAPGEPPNWLAYFGSEDVRAAIGTIRELGGQALLEPTDMGTRTIAVVRDPQGAVFALYAGQFEP
jgi:predicted enzyme related to lactoylglutathione lyase